MAEYLYQSEEAKNKFNNLLFAMVNDDLDKNDILPKLNEIKDLEPDIEDPTFFYYYGTAIKESGDKELAFSLFEKSEEFDDKYGVFKENIMIGHLVKKEIGVHYFFEKGEKANDDKQKRDFYLLAKMNLQKSLGYHNDPEDRHCQLMAEIIRRCESFIDDYDGKSKNSRTYSENNNDDKSEENKNSSINIVKKPRRDGVYKITTINYTVERLSKLRFLNDTEVVSGDMFQNLSFDSFDRSDSKLEFGNYKVNENGKVFVEITREKKEGYVTLEGEIEDQSSHFDLNSDLGSLGNITYEFTDMAEYNEEEKANTKVGCIIGIIIILVILFFIFK